MFLSNNSIYPVWTSRQFWKKFQAWSRRMKMWIATCIYDFDVRRKSNRATPWQRERGQSGYTDERTRGTMCESNEGPRRKSNNDTRTNDTVDKLITRNSGTPTLVSRCFDNYFAYSTKLHPPASSKRYTRPLPSPSPPPVPFF